MEAEDMKTGSNINLAHKFFGIFFLALFVLSYAISGIKAILDRRAIKARMAAKTSRDADPSTTLSSSGRKHNIMVYHDMHREHRLKGIGSWKGLSTGNQSGRRPTPVDFAVTVDCIPADPVLITPVKMNSTLCTIKEQDPVSDFGTMSVSRELAHMDSIRPQMDGGYLSPVNTSVSSVSSSVNPASVSFQLSESPSKK